MSTKLPGEETILEQALTFANAGERNAYLQGVCQGNVELRARIESLIQAHQAAGGFLVDKAAVSDTTVELPSSADTEPGTMIGRYKLLQKIGEGGCGLVYLAEQHEPVRRRVALKIIKLGMDTKQVIARFEAERQALALMDHPNIAKVLDAGATAAGRPYFVMELVRGVKITDYCDQKNLSTAERLRLFIQVCQAIQHAHQKGIIHRDIKPSNILVTVNDGVALPKVIDFGIAKATAGQQLTDRTLFTAFELFIGTPAYMSPEQAEMTSLDIDTRSDIYSLGVLLYELLTSKTPFDPEELMAVGMDEMRRTIREKEPLRPSTRLGTLAGEELSTTAQRRSLEAPKLISLLRGDLDWIVMKALEKDRARRYETANGLAMDIQRYLNQEAVVARPPSAAYRLQKMVRRNKLAFAAAGAVAGALILGSIGSAWQAVRATRAKEIAIKAQQSEALQKQSADEARKVATQKALQAEQEKIAARQNAYLASMLVAQADWDNNNIAHLRQVLAETRDYPDRGFEWYYWQQLCHLELKTFTGHLASVSAIAFFPDGKRIVTVSEDHTGKIWDADTGADLFTLKGHRQVLRYVAVSPDGNRIATGTLGGDATTKIWNAANGQELLELPPGQGTALTFSPDSQRIVTITDQSTARIWDAASGALLRAIPGFVVFSTDQQRVVSTNQVGLLRVWTLATERDLCAIPTTNLAVRAGDFPPAAAAFSPDARRLVLANGHQAEVWNVETGQLLLQLKSNGGFVNSVRFSQNGDRIYTSESGASYDGNSGKLLGGGEPSSTVWDANNGRALRTHTGTVLDVTQDGQRVIISRLGGSTAIWEPDTGRELRTLKGYPQGIGAAVFSPDGRRVLTSTKWNVEDITVKTWEADKQPGFLGLNPGTHAIRSISFSPDGQTFATAGDSRTTAVLETATGRKLVELSGPAADTRVVSFSPDGRRIATRSEDGSVLIRDAKTGATLKHLQGHRGGVRALAFSPDGSQVATGGRDRTVRLWDTMSGSEKRCLRGHKGAITSVAFSPMASGYRLAAWTELPRCGKRTRGRS
jgi:WD40 repeat protein